MRLRLILSFVLIVFITIASILLIVRNQTSDAVRVFMYRGGMTGTEGLVSQLEDYFAQNSTWAGVEQLFDTGITHGRGMGPSQGNNGGMGMMSMQLQLADPAGIILVDTSTNTPSGTLTRQEISRAIELTHNDQTVGYLYPEGSMGFSQSAESNLLNRLNQAALTAALIASGVALLVALFLSYRLLRPVHELTHAANLLAAGDLDQRVTVRGHDELAHLGNTFNQMAGSLQQAEASRRALTADIAHELRTPLAVQRAHLEALEDGIYDLSLENLKPIEEQTRLLSRLVDDLRTLALADSGQLELVRTPTDLPALIQRITTALEPRAADRQIEIQQSLSESCPPLNLDAQRIEQILNNLIDNALRYTPEGGVVSVQCSVVSDQSSPTDHRTPHTEHRIPNAASRILITVKDSGPGIPEEALPHLFERFYRADKSRTRAEGGTGLGLSIARKIAQAHGGDLTASNHPEGGAVFTLVLPIEP